MSSPLFRINPLRNSNKCLFYRKLCNNKILLRVTLNLRWQILVKVIHQISFKMWKITELINIGLKHLVWNLSMQFMKMEIYKLGFSTISRNHKHPSLALSAKFTLLISHLLNISILACNLSKITKMNLSK